MCTVSDANETTGDLVNSTYWSASENGRLLYELQDGISGDTEIEKNKQPPTSKGMMLFLSSRN